MTQKGTAEQVEDTQADLSQQEGGSATVGSELDTHKWVELNRNEWAAAGTIHGWAPKEVATLIRPGEWSETADGEAVKKALQAMG